MKKQYDMIMLDLQMPKRSGKNVAFYLREHLPTYQHTPLLFISANASDMEEQTLAQLRIKKCLQKPIDEETLIREILNALNGQTVSAIDWEKCVKNLSGNHELATSCMSQFIEELHQNKIAFKALIKAKDLKTIGDIAHTLKGACGFLAITPLKQIAHDIETQSVTQLKPLFKALFEEIERVFEAYRELR
jgi:CheY-like chemotaxis protein